MGFDTGTHTGAALAFDGEITGKCIEFPKQRGWQRLQSIAAETERLVKLWQPDVIVIEDYAVVRPSSAVIVVECGTVVRKTLYDLGYWWYGVSPSTLKKWLTGKGNAKKADMLAATTKLWGYKSPSDDVVDAVALAKLGEDIFFKKGIVPELKGLKRHGRI